MGWALLNRTPALCTSALSGQVTPSSQRSQERPHNISLGKELLLDPKPRKPPTHPQNKMSACARRSGSQIPMWTGPHLLPWKLAFLEEEAGSRCIPELGTKENTRRAVAPRPALPTPESPQTGKTQEEKYL